GVAFAVGGAGVGPGAQHHEDVQRLPALAVDHFFGVVVFGQPGFSAGNRVILVGGKLVLPLRDFAVQRFVQFAQVERRLRLYLRWFAGQPCSAAIVGVVDRAVAVIIVAAQATQ